MDDIRYARIQQRLAREIEAAKPKFMARETYIPPVTQGDES